MINLNSIVSIAQSHRASHKDTGFASFTLTHVIHVMAVELIY